MKRLSRAVLIALLFFLLPRGGVFAQTFPRAGGYVNDFAHVLRPDAGDRLRALTAEVKEKTGAELVVVTMPDIGGEDYTEYSNKLFSRWGIGEKGKENGVLIFLALRERKIRIEVGYGLEGILPDGLVGEILDTYAMPYLKQGDYSKGLYGAAIACAAIIAKDAGVMLNGVPRDLRGKRSQPAPPGSLLGSLVFFLFLLFIVLARSGLFPWIVLDGMSRRGGYSGFGGGGFGGGFGGFGGGMSGGGGAGRGF